MLIKTIVLFLFCCLFLSMQARCQETFQVAGKIVSSTGIPLPGAVIDIYSKNDLAHIKISSDRLGKFSLKEPWPRINLKVSLLGFKPAGLLNILPDTSLLVTLTDSSVELKEVSIVSRKDFVEQHFDRTVVNINGDTKNGINGVDILKKSPGVIVKDGSVLLEGKPVTILINGQPVRLSGDDLISMLSNMPTTSLSQLELMPTPSSKYDAAGNGGIINFKTIKHDNEGLEGSFGVSAGHGWKNFQSNGVALNLNYGTARDNFFVEYDNTVGNQYQQLNTNTFLGAVNQQLSDLDTIRTHYFNQNLSAGIDHYFNKNDVVGVLVTCYYNINNPNSFSSTDVFQSIPMRLDSSDITRNYSTSSSKGLNLDLNFSILLDSLKNKKLSGNLDGGVFSYHNLNTITDNIFEFYPTQGSSVTSTDQLNSSLSHIYSVKADYSQKFGKGILEAGFKWSDVNIKNNFNSEGISQGDVSPDNQSDDFKYAEAISASYINLQQFYSRLSIQAGLRIENTYTNGNSLTLDSVVKRNYLNLFPNVTLGYKFKNDLLTGSYSRRIGRPAYNYLNPFVFRETSFQIFEGDPYLRPSFSDNYRLAISINGRFTFSGTYSATNDVISDLKVQEDSTKITTSIKSNLSRSRNGGLRVSYNGTIFKIISLNYSAGLTKNVFDFNYGSAPVHVSQVSGSLNLDNMITLPDTWWFEIHYYGQTKVTYGTAITLPLSTTDIAFGRKLFNKKATLSLRVNDIFFKSSNQVIANYGNVNYNTTSKYDSRNVRINFSYRFGNSKARQRMHTVGSNDEQGRTQ